MSINPINSLLLPRGQEKKAPAPTPAPEPTPAPPTASDPAPAPAPAPEPTPTTTDPAPASEPVGSAAPPSATTPAAGTAVSSSVVVEIRPMPPRLRDLIVKQQTREETALGAFAHQLAERTAQPDASVAAPDVERTAREIIAKASASMVAQANQTRESVLASLTATE